MTGIHHVADSVTTVANEFPISTEAAMEEAPESAAWPTFEEGVLQHQELGWCSLLMAGIFFWMKD